MKNSGYYRIEGHDNIIRDAHSKGLILNDPEILKQEAVRIQRRKQKEASEQRLNNLEEQMNRIEKLLLELINK